MGALLGTASLTTAACGGSVDLESAGGAGGSPVAGAAGSAGGARLEPTTSGVGGEGGEADKGNAATGGQAPAKGGSTGEAGAAQVTDPEGLAAWFAFDKQPQGATRGIYLVPANPVAQLCVPRLTDASANAKQPAFSDDGQFLAYASDESGTYQIHVLDLMTGASEPVTDLPQGASYPTFSPGGLTLAFVTGDPEAVRDGATEIPAGTGDVMLVNLKTNATQLLKAVDSQVDYPYFAPAFASDERLLISNGYAITALYLETQGDEVTVRSERLLTSPGVPQEPAPSPNGLEMAYPDTCDDTLAIQKLEIDLGSTRSCVPASRDFRRDQGALAPDWGGFGFLAVEFAGPEHGISLVFDSDLSNGGWVAGAEGGRNPDWAPPTFRRSCSP